MNNRMLVLVTASLSLLVLALAIQSIESMPETSALPPSKKLPGLVKLPKRPAGPGAGAGPGMNAVARTSPAAAGPVANSQRAEELKREIIDVMNKMPSSFTTCEHLKRLNSDYAHETRRKIKVNPGFLHECSALEQNHKEALLLSEKLVEIMNEQREALVLVETILEGLDELEERAQHDETLSPLIEDLLAQDSRRLDSIRQLAAGLSTGNRAELAACSNTGAARSGDQYDDEYEEGEPEGPNEDAEPRQTSAEVKARILELDSKMRSILIKSPVSKEDLEALGNLYDEAKELVGNEWHEKPLQSGLLAALEGTLNGVLLEFSNSN